MRRLSYTEFEVVLKWKTVSWTVCWTQVFIWITLY
jgi:hypothetical protein